MVKASKEKAILLIDDEILVITALQQFLQKQNYKVDILESSTSGLETIRISPGKYDLLITDLTMPGMDGAHLAEAVHEVNPYLPILIMTGYSESSYSSNLEEFGVRAVVSKPFKLADLLVTIHDLLKD